MKIITTVGTSLIEKYKKKRDDIFSDIVEEDYFTNFQDSEYMEECAKIIKKLNNFFNKEEQSAETTTIQKIIEKYKDEKDFEIHLIATDTLLSYVVAEAIKKFYEGKKNIKVYFDIEKNIIQDLQINDYKKYRDGTRNLISFIKEKKDELYENIILNISGGYKAIVPTLTILGQFYNIPIYYIFEESEELLQIPSLPIDIKWSIFKKYEKVFKDLDDNGIDDWKKYKRISNINDDFPDLILFQIDEGVILSEIGEFLWKEFKDSYFIKLNKNIDLFRDKKGNVKEVEKAILELINRLENLVIDKKLKNTDEILNYIKNLSDQDDLKHGGNLSNNYFIFKSTNINQIRIVYSLKYKDNQILLKVFDYLRNDFNHSKYIEEFKEKLKKSIEILNAKVKDNGNIILEISDSEYPKKNFNNEKYIKDFNKKNKLNQNIEFIDYQIKKGQ
jgi:putative CRISPR-associated protein (TIGR02619 family)